jgi:hypothetical protein
MVNFIKSIIFYLIICVVIMQLKPGLFYDRKNNVKPLNINPNNIQSFITLHTFIFLLALFIY